MRSCLLVGADAALSGSLCREIMSDPMVRSPAATVEQYLEAIPPERRAILAAVRDAIRRNLPEGYREAMRWGAICYEVPLERYGDTYNGQPLSYVSLAAQKNYFTLSLMAVYGSPRLREWLQAEFERAGKKLELSKSCLHFRSLEDLPLDVVGRAVASTPLNAYIAHYEAAQATGPAARRRK